MDKLNNINPTIDFTYQPEKNNTESFLDILIINNIHLFSNRWIIY